MDLMGYDAVNLGELDLMAQEYLAGRSSPPSYSLLSANLRLFAGELRTQPYTVKDVGGRKIAVAGVIGTETATAWLQSQPAGTAEVQDEAEVLRTLVPELRKQADVVIVMAHVGMQRARFLASQVPGIDLMLVGHGGTEAFDAIKIGRTYFVQAGTQGQNVGEITFTITSDGRISGMAGKGTELLLDLPEDPVVKGLVDAYRAGGQVARP